MSSIEEVPCCLCRTRLATLEVELPPHIAARKGSVGRNSGMIALLCALFLSKQGAGEAAEAIEEKKAMEVCEFQDTAALFVEEAIFNVKCLGPQRWLLENITLASSLPKPTMSLLK